MNYGHLHEEAVGSFQDLGPSGASPTRICGYTKSTLLKISLGVLAVMLVIGVLVPLSVLRPKPRHVGPGLIYEPNLGLVDGIYYNVSLSPDGPNAMTERLKRIRKSYDRANDMEDPLVWNCSADRHPDQVFDGAFCVYRTEWLGEECSEHMHFGYGRKKPCIFILFNKVENWIPEPYKELDELPDEMPEELRNHIAEATENNDGKVPEMLWIHCDGEHPVDRENIGPIQYKPWRGFPVYYFPYKEDERYMPPIISVQLGGFQDDILIHLECRAWAKNIHYSPLDGLGMVTVKIFRHH